jgi:hypothetical protein
VGPSYDDPRALVGIRVLQRPVGPLLHFAGFHDLRHACQPFAFFGHLRSLSLEPRAGPGVLMGAASLPAQSTAAAGHVDGS